MEFYHLLNRGVDKRTVFVDDSDRLRFVHDMFVFNDKQAVNPNHRRRNERQFSAERKPIVNIHAYALMPNHYHMLVSERIEGGMALFMRKLNMGYAKYFNERHQRSGVLWQGTFKKVQIKRDSHFLYIPYYIHLNPLDLTFPEWRAGKVRAVDKALQSLNNYRWSSFLDYNNTPNFPSILSPQPLKEMLGSATEQRKIIKQIINDADLAENSLDIEP